MCVQNKYFRTKISEVQNLLKLWILSPEKMFMFLGKRMRSSPY